MKLYTDKQISEIQKKVDSLKNEFGDEHYNNIKGEWLSQTVSDIEKLLSLYDDIHLARAEREQ